MDLAKGVFVAGDQVQIIFGAGLVNDVYEVFAEYNNMKNMSLSDLKTVANKKMNPLQRMIKALSDVFVDIMPGILAAALLTGLSGVLGNMEFVQGNETLFGINRLINISSGAIFGFLPLAVAYSACKRFGGRPILGIVIGCMVLHNKNVKIRELCIPSFISVLFGITEPALFGINLRYRFPIIGGCIGGAFGGVVVYATNLAAVGFGTTVVPGIALADPAGNGYVNYIIAHGVAIAGGFLMTLVLGKFMDKEETPETVHKAAGEELPEKLPDAAADSSREVFYGYARGKMIPLEQVKDATFANKILGDGVAVIPSEGKVYAPSDGSILSVFDTKHAVCLASDRGTSIIIHIGIDTVNLNGKYFTAHVANGDKVKRGQLLIEFDKEKIEKEGYDTVIPMVFADLPQDKKLEKVADGKLDRDTKAAAALQA